MGCMLLIYLFLLLWDVLGAQHIFERRDSMDPKFNNTHACIDFAPDCNFLKTILDICKTRALIESSGCYDSCNMCTHTTVTTYPPPTDLPEVFVDCARNGTNCHDHIGTEFHLMFLELVANGYTHDNYGLLMITADEPGTVVVQCPGINLSKIVRITKGQNNVQIDKAVRALPLQNERKGIRISSSVNISVYALNSMQYESEGYTALPVDSVGKKYVVITYKTARKSLIGITAITDATNVSIHLNASSPITIDGASRNKKSGPFNIVLNRYHSFQLEHTEDLTGTVIESDKPITVISGNQCEMGISYIYECSHYCEQVPPVTSWGRNFIVPKIRTVSGAYIRIIAAYAYTDIAVTGKSIRKNYTIVDPSYRVDVDIGAQTVAVEASRPIYVILVAKYTSSNAKSFMTTVPAIEQFGNSYHIPVPPSYVTTNYLAIMISSKHNLLRLMRLDNNHPAESPTNEETVVVNGEVYTALTISAVSRTDHNITNLNSSAEFGVLMYGFGSHAAYGYPGGMNLYVP